MKSDFADTATLKQAVEKLESDLRREQNSRMKAESMLEDS